MSRGGSPLALTSPSSRHSTPDDPLRSQEPSGSFVERRLRFAFPTTKRRQPPPRSLGSGFVVVVGFVVGLLLAVATQPCQPPPPPSL